MSRFTHIAFRIFVGLAIFINVVFLARLFYYWSTPPTSLALPTRLITKNRLVLDELDRLNSHGDGKAVVALIASTAGICTSDSIVRIFKNAQAKSRDAKLLILVSHSISDIEVSVFKNNADIDFEVRRMHPELDSFYEELSRQYDSPGIIIMRSRNRLIASQNKEEINRFLESF